MDALHIATKVAAQTATPIVREFSRRAATLVRDTSPRTREGSTHQRDRFEAEWLALVEAITCLQESLGPAIVRIISERDATTLLHQVDGGSAAENASEALALLSLPARGHGPAVHVPGGTGAVGMAGDLLASARPALCLIRERLEPCVRRTDAVAIAALRRALVALAGELRQADAPAALWVCAVRLDARTGTCETVTLGPRP